MKSLLIVNPTAGQHDIRTFQIVGAQNKPVDLSAQVEDAFRDSIRQVVVTGASGDAEAAALMAAQNGGFDEVLVAGGDGTVNEVVNGLRKGVEAGGKPLPVGIIPLGTQNVLAQELGIPSGPLESIVGVLRQRRLRQIDLGDADGRRFTLMAGFGFDAAVVADVVRPIKDLIGPAAYAVAGLGALTRYQSTAVKLVLDDEAVHSEAFMVIVANAASYAFRQIKLAPFASMDDGWLDVCVFERAPADRVGFVTQMMAVLARRHLRDPRVRYYRARKVRLVSEPPISGQLDGDIVGLTPVEISVRPRELSVYSGPPW